MLSLILINRYIRGIPMKSAIDTQHVNAQFETSAQADSFLMTASTMTVGYGVLELINHVVLANYVSPYLITLGFSTTTVTVIAVVVMVIAIIGLTYLLTRFFNIRRKRVNGKVTE